MGVLMKKRKKIQKRKRVRVPTDIERLGLAHWIIEYDSRGRKIWTLDAAKYKSFARHIANKFMRRYNTQPMNMESLIGDMINDLRSEANIALMNAIENYDWKRGWKFTTFAFRSISNHLSNYILQANAKKRRPNGDQVVCRDCVLELVPAPDNSIHLFEEREHLRSLMMKLKQAKPQHYQIVFYHYFKHMETKAIAKGINRTRTWVNVLLREAIEYMKQLVMESGDAH